MYLPTYRRHDGTGSARSRTTGEKEEKDGKHESRQDNGFNATSTTLK